MLALIALAIVLGLTCVQRVPARAEPAAPAAAPQTPIAPDQLGMVIRDPWFDYGTNPAYPGQANKAFQDRMGAELAALGVRWVRLDVRVAADLNATPAQITAEVAKNDYFVNEVAPRHGFKVLGLLSFDLLQGVDANLLNTGPYTETSKYGGGVNRYMQSWLDRALLVADRYGDKVAAYQVLNEQNRLPQYVPAIPPGGAIKPEVVGRLITKLYRFCHGIAVLPDEPAHGCQNAQIVMGGLHPRGTSYPTSQSEVDYLKAIYADSSSFAGFHADYGRWPVDGIGYHPYPEEIRQSLPNPKDILVDRGIDRVRVALTEAQDPCVPLWVTEVGYNVGFDPDGSANPIPAQTEVGQAAFLRDVFMTLAARRICAGQPEIAHIFWFKYEDFPPASGVNAQRWGMVRIPFRAPAAGEDCPGGACYDVNGVPSQYRLAYYTYRELTWQRLHLPVVLR